MQAKQFWTKAYQRNIGKMVGVCCRYVGDRAVAEDLAHEAFLKAIEKSGTYRRLGSFDGWLMRINLNTTLDYLRRQPQFLSMEGIVETQCIASLQDETDTDVVETQCIASLQTDTNETHISASDLTESEILSAICALPDKQRAVFNLYVFENQSHAKIAETLKIGVRSSKRYLSEARTQLQNTLNNLVQHKEKSLMILLPFLPWKSHAIDRLCRAKLKHLALSPATPSPLSAVNWTAAPKPGVWMAVTAAKAPAIATGVVATAVTGSVVAWQAQPAPTPASPTPQETAVTTCVAADSAIVNADTAVVIVNADSAVVETQNFSFLQTEINEHPTIEKDPEQQVKGTESSVSPLPATSPTSAPASHHGLIKFERNGFHGLKDARGNVVVYPKYSEIQPFDEYRTGWAMVEIFGFKGFVDSSGKEVVHPQYDDIGKFGRYRDGCALVQKGKFYGFIDTTGKEVVPVKFPLQELTK
ncbi:MAG: sigma-70 family RNA polymerase sigma factor [Bacteroidales bacterium]|nr:sigma-70 family RNA polymerase sigma factor [Bacteroidales bacterium]